jgi:O-antigen/teichoic acid export membrane protein
MAALNLALSFVLIKKIGFFGVAIGSTVSLAVATVYYMRMFHNFIKRPAADFIRLLWKPILASILPMLIVILINRSLTGIVSSSGRIVGIAILGFECAIFGVLYLVLVAVMKYFSKDERRQVTSNAPILKYVI